MPFVIISMGFALAGGIIGRVKGSSFLLWFILSGIPPFIGAVPPASSTTAHSDG